MKPYYDEDGITIYHGDCREVVPPAGPGCLVIDPPWDDEDLVELSFGEAASELVFTDPRRLGQAVTFYGPPTWVFTWDTMSPWQTGQSRPLQQTKQALWYGDLDSYRRDGEVWGEPPPARNHPTTRQVPVGGRRLTDLWRESLRWVHHPEAFSGSAGTERFSARQGEDVLRHAKPEAWVRLLIANTSSGLVFDPFMGSGTSLKAARDLRRPAIGIDIDERCCEYAVKRLGQMVLDLEAA